MFVRSLTVLAGLYLFGGTAIALPDAIESAKPSSTQMFFSLAQRSPEQTGWLRELNLSQEQIQKIKEIRSQYQDRLNEQRQAVRQAQQELKQLMAGNMSSNQIRQKFDQLQTLKQKLADTRMESMLAIRDVLNPDQRQKLNDIIRQQGQPRRDRLNNP